MNNNLEKFFRIKLTKDMPNEGWNDPGDDMWERIESGLEKENPSRKGYFLWIFGSLVLGIIAAGLLYIYNQDARISTLESEMALFNKTSSHSISEITKNDFQLKDGLSVEVSNTELVNHNEVTIKNNNDIYSKNKNRNANLNNFNLQNPSNNTSSYQGYYQVKYYDNLSNKQNTSDNQINVINKDIQLALHSNELINIGNLVNPYQPILTYHRLLPLSKQNYIINEAQKKLSKTYLIGLSANYRNAIDRTSGSFENPLEELLINDRTLDSYTYGLQSIMTLNSHLALHVGIQYGMRTQKSSYLLNLPYEKSTELQNASGDYFHEYQHSLPTGLGNVSTNVILARSVNSSIEENESVAVDFAFENKNYQISIPLSLAYYTNEVNQGLFFQFGLMNDFVIKNRIENIKSFSHHSEIVNHSVKVDFTNSQINKFGLSAFGGIGYQETIFKNLDLIGNINYGIAFTNIYSTNSYQHKIDHISVGLSLLKRFDCK